MKTSTLIALAAGLVLSTAGRLVAPVSPASRGQHLTLQLVPGSGEVRAGQPIVLWLAVYNGGASAAGFDARMNWPGNIALTVWTPGASGPTGAETTIAMQPLAAKRDILVLPPRRFYGRKLVIGPGTDAPIRKELKSTKRGRYAFRASYRSVKSPEVPQEELILKSNRVMVTVR